MATADDAGPVALRVDFPVGAGRIFPALFSLLLAGCAVLLWRGHGVGGVVMLLPAAVLGFLITLVLRRRKPTSLEVREKGLAVFFGSRVEVIAWPSVRGIEQEIHGMAPIHVVLIDGTPSVPIGGGDRAVALAQEIVRRAGLRWLHEPFSAARPATSTPKSP